MKILNGNEAFAAIAAGQNIECRLIHQDHDFQDIKQFTATVYFDPRYEFRIAIKFFTIGEMQVPEAIQEAPAKGIQCFVPSVLTEVLSKAFKWKNSDLDLALMQRGQVHLIQEHAEIHAQALIKISGGSFENVQNSTSNDVVEKTFDSQSNIQITEQGPITVVEDSLLDPVEISAVDEVSKTTAITEQAEPVHEHQDHLDILLNDISLAKTPIEANAQIKYTKSWSEDQRKPVIQAINKRLSELKSMAEPKPEETPSLMVQIQNAPDLTALDVLEIDVGSRHPDIQPKLMGYVEKRRFELETGGGPVGAPL